MISTSGKVPCLIGKSSIKGPFLYHAMGAYKRGYQGTSIFVGYQLPPVLKGSVQQRAFLVEARCCQGHHATMEIPGENQGVPSGKQETTEFNGFLYIECSSDHLWSEVLILGMFTNFMHALRIMNCLESLGFFSSSACHRICTISKGFMQILSKLSWLFP